MEGSIIMKNSTLCFSIIGVAIAIALPIFYKSEYAEYAAISICCILIIFYPLFNRNFAPSALFAIADHTYLLGYLYTIAALLGVGARLLLEHSDVSPSTAQILSIAGMKMSTTVVGLMVMLHLRTRALGKEKEHLENEEQNLHKLREALPNIDFPDVINKFVNVVVESWKCDLEKLKDCLDSMTRVSEELKTLKSNVSQFSGKIITAEDATGELAKSLEKITGNTNILHTTQREANSAMSEFAKNVKQTDKALDEFIKLVQIKIQNLKNE